MSEISISEMNFFINSITKSTEIVLNTPRALTEVLASIFQKSNLPKAALDQREREIAKGIREDKIDVITVNKKDAMMFQKKLQDMGIQPLEVGVYKNQVYYFLSPEDRIKVLSANEDIGIESYYQSTGILENEETEEIKCVNKEESDRVQSEAAKENIYTESSMRPDGSFTVKFKKEDKERVDSIFKENMETYVSAKDLKKVAENISVYKVDTEMAAYDVLKRAEQAGIRINIAEEGFEDNASYIIRFDSKDTGVMNRIMRDTSIDMAGKSGQDFAMQIQYYIKNECNIMTAIINNDIEDGNVIVDRNGNNVTVNDSEVIFTSDTEQITINRNNKNFDTEVANLITNKLDKPILLSAEEYKEYQESDNKGSFLNETEISHGKPELSEESLAMMKAKEDKREIINEKLSQYQAEEIVFDVNVYNTEQSFVVFNEYNINNTEIEHDMAQINKEMPSIIDDARMMYIGAIEYDDIIDNDGIDAEEQADAIFEEQADVNINTNAQEEERDQPEESL